MPALETKPVLDEWELFVWGAWASLSEARTYGWSKPNPLQISEIEAWCRLNGVDDIDERRTLLGLIQSLDLHWRIMVSDKMSKADAKSKSEAKDKARR